MSKIFGKFYHKLYNCLTPANTFNFTQGKFEEFFSDLELPKLSTPDLASLHTAITAEELLSIVKDLLNKSPGPDGLSYFYYKTFIDILSPHMLTLFDSLLKGKPPNPQFSHSYITVIPKPGKDPSIPDNYRPIALLN